jgi:hypothetical protein
MLHTHQTVVLPDGRTKEWEGPLDETDYDRKRHNWLKKRKMTNEDVRTTISMLNHEKRYILTYVLFFTTSWTMIVRGRFFGNSGFEMTYNNLSHEDTMEYVRKYSPYLY